MFYKEKGFYISLLCGVVALVAFGVICMQFTGGDEPDSTNIAAEESQEPVQTAVPKTEQASTNEAESEVKEKKSTPKPTKKAVKTSGTKVQNTLHFDQETGLLWPIKGDVLMEYSAEQVVYFKTLAQYRTNPAILISAKVGDSVKASADGIVENISTSEETGRTLTMSLGDQFSVSYGQLKGITVEKGERVTEGQVIGKIAEPTKYYSLEGANLYYQVKQKNKTVNPMILLR